MKYNDITENNLIEPLDIESFMKKNNHYISNNISGYNLWNSNKKILIRRYSSFLFENEFYFYVNFKQIGKRKIDKVIFSLFKDNGPQKCKDYYCSLSEKELEERKESFPHQYFQFCREGEIIRFHAQLNETKEFVSLTWKVCLNNNQVPLFFDNMYYHDENFINSEFFESVDSFEIINEKRVNLIEHVEEMNNTRKKLKRKQTSFVEQALFYYIHMLFPDAKSRFKINGIETDIFVASLNCAIEYDGYYWHKNKKEKDEQKIEQFLSLGLSTINIRDSKLPDLNKSTSEIFYFNNKVKSDKSGLCLCDLVTSVVNYLAIVAGEHSCMFSTLYTFSLSEKQLIDDSPTIWARIFNEPESDNYMSYYGIDQWDYTRNGTLLPENIPVPNNPKVFWLCKRQCSIYCEMNKWLCLKEHCLKDCGDCLKKICPYFYNCHYDCQEQYDYAKKILHNNDYSFAQSELLNIINNSQTGRRILADGLLKNDEKKLLYFAGWCNCIEDVGLIKEYALNKKRPIIINARKLDINHECRLSFTDYCRWMIQDLPKICEYNEGTFDTNILRMLDVNECLSNELINMIEKMLDSIQPRHSLNYAKNWFLEKQNTLADLY